MKRLLIPLALALTALTVGLGPPTARAQEARLLTLDAPATVVEAGSFRLIASVGTPTLGSALLAHHARRGHAAEAMETALDVPEAFELASNYPNPFNPETTIPFALPEAQRVRLAVYDVLGREVQVLVDDELAAGRHTARFEARGLPSGAYFYRIEAGSFTTVRQMMLVK